MRQACLSPHRPFGSRLARRFGAPALALGIVPGLLILPTLTAARPRAHPVRPVVATLALAGVERPALAAAARRGLAASPLALPVPGGVPGAAKALAARPADGTPELFTAERTTRPFSTAGVTWRRGSTPPGMTVQLRTRTGGRWSAWDRLEIASAPDASTPEGRSATVRAGTEPIVTIGGSDGVQVRVDTADGALPPDLRLTLIDPGTSAADATADAAGPAASAAADPLRPTILPRSAWGADESLRTSAPTMMSTIKFFVVHHTASTNDYTAATTAAQIRGIYAYATLGQGWSDYPYSFVIDKYGRTWEGRAGGIDKPIKPAMTGGFNDYATGVGVLGNFEDIYPTSGVLAAISRLGAWKLALHRVDPLGSTRLTATNATGTTSRYANGTTITTRTMFAHRDVGYTACDGGHLYPYMATIRALAASFTGAALFAPGVAPAAVRYGSGATIGVWATVNQAQTWAVDVRPLSDLTKLTRHLAGVASRTAPIRTFWDGKDSTGRWARPGGYLLALSSPGTAPVRVAVYVTGTDVAGPVLTGTVPPVAAGGLAAVAPVKVLDTLAGLGWPRPLNRGNRLDLKVTGVGGVPASGVSAVALSVSAPYATATNRLVFWPAGGSPSLNGALWTLPSDGSSTTTIVPVGVAGRVSVANVYGDAEAVVHVVGWLGAGSSGGYVAAPAQPVVHAGWLTPTTAVSVPVAGVGGIPATVRSVLVNTTADYISGDGTLALSPTAERPATMHLNKGVQTRASSIVALDAGGRLTLSTTSPRILTYLQVLGWFQAGAPGKVTPMRATRLADTATGVGVAAGPLGAGSIRAVRVRGVAGIPLAATAVLVDLTATSTTAPTQLGLYASGATPPARGALVVHERKPRSSFAVVPIGADWNIAVRNEAGSTGLTLDVVGWVAPAGAVSPPPPPPGTYVLGPDAALSLAGRGNGHGRGMSQYGAYGSAVQGATVFGSLARYYPGTTASTVANRYLRVLIVADTDGDLTVLPATGMALWVGSTRYGLATTTSTGVPVRRWRIRQWPDGQHVEALIASTWVTGHFGGRTANDGALAITSSNSVRLVLPNGSQTTYRGYLRAVSLSGVLRVLDVVDRESYLRSVVPAEMYATWPGNALQMQAVASRTYVERVRLDGVPSGRFYDICDSTMCQVYPGYATYSSTGALVRLHENAHTDVSVAAVAGRVLTTGGRPISALFSAANGGWSVSGGVSYLPAAPDPADGVAGSQAWARTLTAATLHAAWPTIGTPLSIRILSRDGHGDWGGRVTAVTVTGTAGSVLVSGDTFRFAVGLRSTWWTVVA